MLHCGKLKSDLRKERIPDGARRALQLEAGHTHYKGLEDAAIIAARIEPTRLLAKTRRGEAIIGDDYVKVRKEARTESEAKEVLLQAHKKLSDKDFFRRYVITRLGKSCTPPCSPKVEFDAHGDLKLDCSFKTSFSRSQSVPEIQREVLRIAEALGIDPVRLPHGKLQSGCPGGKAKGGQRRRRRGPLDEDEPRAAPKAGQPELTTAQRVISQIDAPFLMKPFKGALMWHTVGAGKTCAAMLVANVFVNAGWRVIWASTAQLKFAPAVRHFFDIRCHDQDVPTGANAPKTADAKEAYLKRNFLDVVSYSTLSNGLESGAHTFGKYLRGGIDKGTNDPLHKTLLIFDEPHKIREMKGNQKASWAVFTRSLHASYKKSGDDSARVLFMDATPAISDPGELIEMLNALQPDADKRMPISFAQLRSQGYLNDLGLTAKGKAGLTDLGKGVISYLNMSADATRFARPVRWTFNPVAMSQSQLDKMNKDCKKAVRKRECAETTAVSVNMPRGKFSAGMKAELAKRAPESFPLLTNLLENIKRMDEEDIKEHGRTFKHAIFTNVPNALHAENIMKVLLADGLSKVDPLARINVNGVSGGKGILMLSGSGITPNQKASITGYFNAADNAHGEKARFLLIDGRFREGIDVFDTRHFHLLQPLEKREETQAIGRVLRMCGSTHLPNSDNIWQVRVHLYDAIDADKGKNVYNILQVMGDADKLNAISQFEDFCKSIAFDHLIFQGYNVPLMADSYRTERPLIMPNPCGKLESPDETGNCPKGFVAGPSERNPDKKCCYSTRSKKGREIKAKMPKTVAVRSPKGKKAAAARPDAIPLDTIMRPENIRKAKSRATGARTGAKKSPVPCPRLKTKALSPGVCPVGYQAFQSKTDPSVTCCKKK